MPSHMNFKQLIMLTKKLKIAMTSIALVLLTFAASAQTQVKGTITSSRDGKGIAGAAVVNKNSKAATQTDANGTFSIAAKVGDKIAVSYVGFVTQEVTFLANQVMLLFEASIFLVCATATVVPKATTKARAIDFKFFIV
jgi:hypothetical protein